MCLKAIVVVDTKDSTMFVVDGLVTKDGFRFEGSTMNPLSNVGKTLVISDSFEFVDVMMLCWKASLLFEFDNNELRRHIERLNNVKGKVNLL